MEVVSTDQGNMGFEFFNMVDPRAAGERSRKNRRQNGMHELLLLDECCDNLQRVWRVIFHEACGHALEVTGVAKGASVFANSSVRR